MRLRRRIRSRPGFEPYRRPTGIWWAPIFYFNCEHVLFVCIVQQNQKQTFVDFQNLQKSNFVRSKFSEIRTSIDLPWGHSRSHKNIWARSVQLFRRLLNISFSKVFISVKQDYFRSINFSFIKSFFRKTILRGLIIRRGRWLMVRGRLLDGRKEN